MPKAVNEHISDSNSHTGLNFISNYSEKKVLSTNQEIKKMQKKKISHFLNCSPISKMNRANT